MSDLKDSGSYWLGEIPEDWEMLPAWALFTEGKEKCGADDPHLVPSRVYGVVTRDDLTELSGNKPVDNEASAHNMKHVNPHDFIISMGSHESGIEHSRLVGKVSNDYRVLRPTNDVNPEYYKWFFKSDPLIEGLRGLTTEIRVGQRIHYSRFSLLRLPIPSAADQQRIADYLDRETAEIDAAVADLDRYVELLKSRTKNLLQHLISTETSESDLRPIWSLFEPVKRLDHPHEEVLSVYRDYGVVSKDSREDNRNRTPEDVSTYQLVLIDDLVVNKMKAWQGSLAVSEHRGIVSPDYQVAQPITDNLPKYLHYALRCQKMVDQYLVYSNGIRPAQWRLYWEELSRILVPIPAVSVQNEIIRKLDQETAEIDALIEESTKLRDFLLKRRSVLITEVVTGRRQV